MARMKIAAYSQAWLISRNFFTITTRRPHRQLQRCPHLNRQNIALLTPMRRFAGGALLKQSLASKLTVFHSAEDLIRGFLAVRRAHWAGFSVFAASKSASPCF